jgi:hypothetical protein
MPPKKSRSKVLLGAVVLLVPLAIGAFYLSQKSSNGSSDTTALSTIGNLVATESLSVQPPPPPTTAAESAAIVAAAPLVDSQAIKDSIRRARREAAKKAAALDSARKAQANNPPPREAEIVRARVAARAMLEDGAGRKAFMEGATHKGGVLGTQRKGDLQTQIDALAPFLSRAGLSYDQFKSLARESGVNLFDQFGRILPSALQQFASGG